MTNKDRRRDVLSLVNRPAHVSTACGARQKTALAQKHFEVPDEVLAQLREAVMARRVEDGLRWFEEHRTVLAGIDPEQHNSAPLIGYLSQWVSVSDGVAEAVRELLTFFPQPVRGQLPLDCYIHLRLADGVLKLANGEPEAAAIHFDFIISFQHEPIDPELAALAHFWKALCERKRGKCDSALTHAERASALILAAGRAPAAAMMQALEGCLNVQKGRFSRAMELLREADPALQQTDDFVWLGNVQFAYGSIAMEEGRYESAFEHFAKAARRYQACNLVPSQLAESLVSLAHSQRLIAVRIARAIDSHAERRRKSAGSDSVGRTDADTRQDVEQRRGEALSNLTVAIEMFSSLGESRGLALACIERGFLLVDCGQFDRADLEANEAFELGGKIKDPVVMAYARLLESRIESAQYDEGIGDSPAQHAQLAHDFAKDALTYALQTEDRQLLANAYLCQGQIFCNEFFNNADAASECCRQAGQLLTTGNRNQLWDEHQALTRKVARNGSVDSRLREWSQGLAGGKTFQQMTEEFADLVIPSVWEREGRNVSRVVAKLSISPKKVRRILGRAGLKTGIE
jgi:tetratricopeptide (TPR) repeat protein